MIQLRRAGQRHRLRSGGQDVWLTFYPSEQGDSLAHGFSTLMALNEGFVRPEGNMLSYSRRGSRTITYVVQGSMFLKTRSYRSTLVQAGEFQCSSADLNDGSIQSNASEYEPLHVLQLSLWSEPFSLPAAAPQQRTFSSLERSGRVCLVGSADGRAGSLPLGQDVSMYSGTLAADQTLHHPVAANRVTWLQVLSGTVSANGVELRAGDGAGFSHVPVVSLSATEDAEVLLLDLFGALPHEQQKSYGSRDRRGAAEREAFAAAPPLFTQESRAGSMSAACERSAL